MKIMCQKLFFSLLAAAVMPVLAETSRTLYYCDMSHDNKPWYFRLPDGTAVDGATVAADKGCELRTTELYNGWENPPLALHNNLDLYSWTISPLVSVTEKSGAWVEGGGKITLGAGGLSIDPDLFIHIGSKSHANRITLSADQTWTGPKSGSAWGQFAVGSVCEYNGYYWDALISADKDIAWTLDGRIKLIMTAANTLSNVDVVVNPEARLILVEKWRDQVFAGRLGAKSLTLKGGDAGSSSALFTLGARNIDTSMGETYAPATFDDETVAKHVILENGADITCGEVDYSLGRLTVSGGSSNSSGFARYFLSIKQFRVLTKYIPLFSQED